MSAYVSAFELFSIGVGPSSSHTVGPMRAGRDFADRLRASGRLSHVARVTCALYGSLGATGIGHGTPDAVVAGLQGAAPETVDPEDVRHAWTHWPEGAPLQLAGTHPVPFAKADVVFAPRTRLPGHPNAMTVTATDADGATVAEETYYSVGGGFIRRDGEPARVAAHPFPLAYESADQLLALCDERGITIAEAARLNEQALRSEEEVAAGLDAIWDAMAACVEAGLAADGVLPGMLKVKRRAGVIRGQLEEAEADGRRELPGEWLGAFALAVNEENASGGRVVTAPTNGAAGILPAVGMYWWRFLADSGLGSGNAVTPYGELVGSALLGFHPASPALGGEADAPDPDAPALADANRRRGIRRFLLTATALGSLFKANASISGAEGGCQAEVGSACAMAAAGLTAVMGGTNRQIENAAEIAMEHHLGLTCDPVGGLVQIPCIERNAIAASTAVTASRLALRGDGTHYVSLDAVVETMRQTGIDMSTKYKETSEGGLAVNVIEC
ncbi:L-serine ammonia-lyase, iron-sulfur-dependent, subunit alpha [Microbacterium sp. zg.Y1090]|uniref:L-serine ammonia-lyase, iron-sulfur-dependent, subunit alpha n=1 Tax=Microbacterium TaxID=33882 RepID=UPI00214CB854|nr:MULTISPECIES: L-serine ammonia-lyase, iron-sulfur-dependent, subunit alpha [unclassified Microbacterium]MCR2812437.1 L-serine ammonia-lyase, iron-sulfur-dependent, subunit alpha [Microbacterium sp. zg.Y1084]MCR2817762.1 L-serine ammonia-lyase, iron-sulfur-dependent, subunit alpha [Microbacterium sp. zg.Y1090]MDL5485594.1 L-serine ammonia-lyase, iron-sulfur-dependent, subunit alpha [Microbacterium sp. zg-Y1211]WIM28765.1 L-serine ammonia-lyase, iron-sulfur-dependent, subunit alpha [Microbacte